MLYSKPWGDGHLDHCYLQTRQRGIDLTQIDPRDGIVDIIPPSVKTVGGEINEFAFLEAQFHYGCFGKGTWCTPPTIVLFLIF